MSGPRDAWLSKNLYLIKNPMLQTCSDRPLLVRTGCCCSHPVCLSCPTLSLQAPLGQRFVVLHPKHPFINGCRVTRRTEDVPVFPLCGLNLRLRDVVKLWSALGLLPFCLFQASVTSLPVNLSFPKGLEAFSSPHSLSFFC